MNNTVILILFVSFLIFSCSGVQDQNSDKPFEFDSKYVSEFENENFDIDNLQFIEVETIKLDLDQNGEEDFVYLYNCKGWENDPGDFRKIIIKLNGSKVFESINMTGWINISDELRNGSKYKPFMFVKSEIPLLALMGYNYASEPGWFTLIYLNEINTKVVFNQKFELITFEKIQKSIKFQGEFQEKHATIIINGLGLKFLH